MIDVTQTRHSDPLEFDVTVGDGGGETRHHVTMRQADVERLAGSDRRPADCIEAAFRFLLDREPKEAILARFELSVISIYFPEFEAKLPAYIAGGRG